ncbi:hypothetical protein [Alkaliphilus serpentinus]|uniref:Uncharacterized protein n=1 Tax=Alkaliphilus serpentinus TaxID=1482731 RepID=A0A833HRF6_9FIRM|nr:hypothetical protein [Alkaliphilus serpentinus]KAB3533238.1 hypothetical protein F8153_01445 [Alkaliphilus serpentinus]
MIQIEEETYGVCCLGAVNEEGYLLELTLKETLRIAKEKWAAVVFIHALEERVQMFESIGFKTLKKI